MIVKFDDKKYDKVGNKAESLILMKEAGFNVPNGFILDSDTYNEEIKLNNLDKKINKLLDELHKKNIKDISEKINKLFNNFKFSEDTINKVLKLTKDNKLYAVRSSGTKEDLENYSFAGQYKTILNTKKEEILKCIIE